MEILFDTAESIAINELEKAAEDLDKAGKLAHKFIEWGEWITKNTWSILIILLVAFIITNFVKRK